MNTSPVTAVSVRYIVDDVDDAIEYYALLGFEVAMHPGPGFAMLTRQDLRLLLNTPGGGGAMIMASRRPMTRRGRPGGEQLISG